VLEKFRDLTFLTDLGNRAAKARMARLTKDERTALHKCLLFMEAFRIIGPIMPMQHAYAFLLVAMEEGRGVQEYAERAGVIQSVMTRILSALGRHRQKGAPGYGLVHQATDTEDLRKRQTFLTAKGEALMREIVRVIRSDDQRSMKLHISSRNLMTLVEKSPRDLAHDQWLPRLIAAARKLDSDDIKLAVGQIEALIGHRESKRHR
jgi:DNA-binding MarR family transcriptional regulator